MAFMDEEQLSVPLGCGWYSEAGQSFREQSAGRSSQGSSWRKTRILVKPMVGWELPQLSIAVYGCLGLILTSEELASCVT